MVVENVVLQIDPVPPISLATFLFRRSELSYIVKHVGMELFCLASSCGSIFLLRDTPHKVFCMASDKRRRKVT
jgi:hypothetical protein